MELAENKLIFKQQGVKHIFTSDNKVINEFFAVLKTKAMVTLSDFEKDFQMGHVLGSGNHAEVNVGTQINTGKTFAIKSLPKKKLLASPVNLVYPFC